MCVRDGDANETAHRRVRIVHIANGVKRSSIGSDEVDNCDVDSFLTDDDLGLPGDGGYAGTGDSNGASQKAV